MDRIGDASSCILLPIFVIITQNIQEQTRTCQIGEQKYYKETIVWCSSTACYTVIETVSSVIEEIF